MSLATGTGVNAVGNEIFAYSNRIDFSAGSSGEERVALDFVSPNSYYVCDVAVSLDSGSWAASDIMAVIYRGNGNNIYQSKWGVGDLAAISVGPQTIPSLRIILPPNTVFRALFQFTSGTAMVGSGIAVLVGRKIGPS